MSESEKQILKEVFDGDVNFMKKYNSLANSARSESMSGKAQVVMVNKQHETAKCDYDSTVFRLLRNYGFWVAALFENGEFVSC